MKRISNPMNNNWKNMSFDLLVHGTWHARVDLRIIMKCSMLGVIECIFIQHIIIFTIFIKKLSKFHTRASYTNQSDQLEVYAKSIGEN